QTMVDTLQHLADRCDGDKRPDCPILHDLERSEA
ncbi:MAG: Cu(I)-responsive transcriptional regulator, partial [Pseudomonadota bacterium]